MSIDITATPDSPWVRSGQPIFQPFLYEGELRIHKPGDVIYFQGESSPGLFYIHRGRFKTTIYYSDGREKILAIQDSPTTFGEAAAFDCQPYFCTAVALDQCQVYLFRTGVIRKLISVHPEIAFSLMESIGRKLRLLALQVEDLTFLDAPPRIAHLLTKLVVDYGASMANGDKLTIPITHQELADVAGTSRITVTTVLNRMEREGIIRKKRNTIYIHDRSKLHQFTQVNSRRAQPERMLGRNGRVDSDS